MKLAIGLGNPGRAYAGTRHNAGWMALDVMARRHGAVFHRAGLRPVQTAKLALEGAGAVALVKPLTYMNLSGTVLPALMRKSGATPADLVVVLDDVSLPLGTIRVRAGGSAGGHHGLESVIEHVGTQDVARIRVGIGTAAREGRDLKEYVLEPMSAAERDELEASAARAADALETLLRDGADKAMNEYNERRRT